MADARLFQHQLEVLSSICPVAVSQFGDADSVREMARQVLETLPERAILIGASLGGMVAMEIQRRAPARVSHLVLIATDALSEPPGVAASREPMITRARAGRLDDAMAEAVPVEALAPGPTRSAALDIQTQMARRAGAARFEAQSRALQRRPDQQGTLRRIPVPTLILSGAHDTLFPARRHELMTSLVPQAQQAVLDDAGHLPTLEVPERVTQVMTGWLQAQDV